MVMLGMANSRMKDFYDLCDLAGRFEFHGLLLTKAIAATFSRRQTDLPKEVPTALSPDFTEDTSKQTQWRAFLRKSGLSAGSGTLGDVTEVLRSFLIPPTDCLRLNKPFKYRWSPGGPWISIS